MNFLVTGGASGLGASIVRQLALSNENHIYFTYAKSASLALAITAEFKNTTAIPCNFQAPDSVQLLVNQIADLHISVLINNAVSFMHKDYFQKMDAGNFLSSFSNNVLPTLQITQACINAFRKQKFGKIINIGSAANIGKPPIGWSEYVANKAYLISMSKSWATENIKFNITSNCISPSFMKTNLTADTDERLIDEMIISHPLKKILTTEEVAESVIFLCHCSMHINGINLVMNAGSDIS